MATILDEIVEQTARDLHKRKQKVSLRDLESHELFEQVPRNFKQALAAPGISIIAEIKKASPSKGHIRRDFDPRRIARQYQEGGASAISVLTDQPAFEGRLEYLEMTYKETSIPLLRKDFIIDPYQVKEAKAYGADAVLLIVAITQGEQLDELIHAAREFGVQALVECYSEEDFNQVPFDLVDILGVNNRDLRTFEVDLHRGVELLQRAPEDTITVSESGLDSADDLQFLAGEEIDAALIGEHFMRQPDPGKAVKRMKMELQEHHKLST
ncbi:MAG TPA: indole-3-glycerol phosphate synthase TrpC [Fodinibius sp.]|nr:indole-3-glycerol phosphate synthase TrpC [Fodinibius sp.]